MEVNAIDELQAGTGFMIQLRDGITYMQECGYIENFTLKYDHFECRSGEIHLNPEEFQIDGIMRFENTSDPDDQSILYAISSIDGLVKGAYAESYGLYHEDLSPEMLENFKHLNSVEEFSR